MMPAGSLSISLLCGHQDVDLLCVPINLFYCFFDLVVVHVLADERKDIGQSVRRLPESVGYGLTFAA
ncbi:hypothetical protein RU06_04325 [Curtobacterium flaccumfaciens]|nr:hypothetical protein RU06_04325 [Curtobacterium flaccumfaciens]